PGLDLAALRAHLAERLPDYACPVFLRLVASLEVTETFKQKKQSLAAEGWDPTRIAEPLWVEDRATGAYVALDNAGGARVRFGNVRLERPRGVVPRVRREERGFEQVPH